MAIDFSAVQTGIDLEQDNIDRLHARVGETSAALVRRVDTFSGQVIQAAERFRREADERVARANPGEERALIRQMTEREFGQSVNEYRRTLVESTERERRELLEALDRQLARMNTIADLFPSPAAMLGRVGLGTPRHAALVTALEKAGPVELEQRAREALMTGDRVLASAVLAAVDRRPRKDQTFSPADFSAAVLGDEHKAFLAKVGEMREKVAAARDLDRAFTVGKSDPTSRIERGLAARRAAS